jgi:Fe-S-cluster containining protein
MPSLRSMLPEVYHPLLPGVFDAQVPEEEKATCGQCPMVAPAGTSPGPDNTYFRPDTKCCTFHPHLPNYLVGAILKDERPDMVEGVRRMKARIALRVGVGPQYVAAPRKFTLLYMASRSASFGRSLMLRCPYYESERGLCTVWRHRDSVCTHYFCKHVAGVDGQAFWRAFDVYMRKIENRLAEHAAREVGPDLGKPSLRPEMLTLEELEDRAPDPEWYAGIWEEWVGREEEFYRACHEVIAGLDKEAFARITDGEDMAGAREAMLEAHRKATGGVLPERLALDPEAEVQRVEGGVVVTTYSRFDPVVLDGDLWEVLQAFRGGQRVGAVQERLRRQVGGEIPEEVLLKLYRARVLVEEGEG